MSRMRTTGSRSSSRFRIEDGRREDRLDDDSLDRASPAGAAGAAPRPARATGRGPAPPAPPRQPTVCARWGRLCDPPIERIVRRSPSLAAVLVWSTPFSNLTARSQSDLREDVEVIVTTGTIKKVVADRGFGFITAEDGKDYFFHRDALQSSLDFDRLVGGERVSFKIEQGPKGPRANDVAAA